MGWLGVILFVAVVVGGACIIASVAWLMRRVVERRNPPDPYAIDAKPERAGFDSVGGLPKGRRRDLMPRERGR